MLRNYLKTAWRNLINNPMHSMINAVGLSFGMAVAILIGLWIYDEVSFDKQSAHHDRIAQVMQNVTNNGEVQTWRNLPYPLAEELRKNYGGDFKHIVMSVGRGDHILTIGNQKLKQQGAYFEKGFADMFSLNMLHGDRHALNDPSSILIAASVTKAYFGNASAINQVISIDNKPPVKVAGVYNDFPKNSSFEGLNFIASLDFLYANDEGLRTMEDPWRPNFTAVYVELNDNTNFVSASARIKDAKLKKVNAQLQKKKPALFLHPMNKWHLYSEFKNGVNTGGAIQYVWMFGIIGVFVLLLACINFMNLSTARSEKRAKEVGIRKTIGSLRIQLIYQFFSESLVTVVGAFAVSLLMVQFALPLFNQVANKQVHILWSNPVFWLLCIAFIVITGLTSGSYPALYLSSFKPIKVLKGTFKAGPRAAIPRKILVVMQFTVSVVLIIGTIVVYKQIQFARNRPIGYSREGLLGIPVMNASIHDHFEAVKSELLQTGVVTSVAESESPTTSVFNSTSGFSWPGKDPNLSTDFGVVNVSSDYGKTVGWHLKEGRDFSKDFGSDTSNLIINEAAVHYMGLKDPVGTQVSWWGKPYTIIGVVSDMVMESPYIPARPVIHGLLSYSGYTLLRLNPSVSARDALSKIETVFKKYNTEQPFEYQFVDEDYASKFGDEERVGRLAGFFALLAVTISCLGLFGLASFVAEQRTKEIGVRKVLGASVFNLWNLLSKEFVTLVLISFAIAAPIAWYFTKNWLDHYQYRTTVSWWIFLFAGIGVFVITMVTVSFQSLRAATGNPVKSLRSE